jgi:putative transposon-encoded protein
MNECDGNSGYVDCRGYQRPSSMIRGIKVYFSFTRDVNLLGQSGQVNRPLRRWVGATALVTRNVGLPRVESESCVDATLFSSPDKASEGGETEA